MNNEINEISKNAHRIFYVVNPYNKQLKKETQEEVIEHFASLLKSSVYSIRSGIIVQNPKKLFDEIEGIGIEKFEIVCVTNDGAAVLSHNQKVDFYNQLKDFEGNSGKLAYLLSKNDPGTTEPEYEEDKPTE